MFLPYFIALFLGFVSPSNTSCTGGTSTTVNVTNSEDGDPGDQPPGDDTGGEGGQIKIPK
ncbi:hypothetical protein EV200_103437 [Pedobacter psychrotolerans]|uniref:Uncharacterized protein n=1 Tax=Pedobacter psychrotolerans TaxID=1843235 RepID=A0A4R2HJA6_9SPHI|nr:hypothetical protein [Pedobacter psychrotolerans]TCO27103.1 hypothetical protein EV200_103437 [Pedobacter psychrotolerans]GGE58900.1 hypothetical protein GCM10011413_26750 [Pedobacter psychrotolerans]